MATTTISQLLNYKIATLQTAAEHFEGNKASAGYQVFSTICRIAYDDARGVYRQMALIQGCPSDAIEEGQRYFCDEEGKITSAAQKADAIRRYIKILASQETQTSKMPSVENISSPASEPKKPSIENIPPAAAGDKWEFYKQGALYAATIATGFATVGAIFYSLFYRESQQQSSDGQDLMQPLKNQNKNERMQTAGRIGLTALNGQGPTFVAESKGQYTNGNYIKAGAKFDLQGVQFSVTGGNPSVQL
jgi:hypothetical protein